MPIGNGCRGTVSPRHFRGIGLNPIAAHPAPYDQVTPAMCDAGREAAQEFYLGDLGYALTDDYRYS